jgi:osmoprotectant transport system substrate-binding protein
MPPRGARRASERGRTSCAAGRIGAPLIRPGTPSSPMPSARLLLVVLALALPGVLVSACGSEDSKGDGGAPTATAEASQAAIQRDEANADTKLTIGSKNFTEQRVLGEIYAQGLQAAGYDVETKLDLGDEHVALKAVEGGEIDAYPEYTGTALQSFFGKEPENLPKDPQAAYEEAKADFAKRGLVAFPPTPFTSSNEVAVTKETADRLGLAKISDLSKDASKLTLAGSPECRQRFDCLRGLEDVYGLKFGRFMTVEIPKRHEVLTSGKADVSIVFTTDPQIQRESEVLLEDDKSMFGPQNSTLVMRKETADRAGPDLPRVLEQIQQRLTDENMQELNARVDLDGQTPAAVAEAYLTENGLIPGG